MSVTTTKPRRLLCRAWEVRAYLSGTKTQFRVPIKPQPRYMDGRWWKGSGGSFSTLDYVSRETATGIETESVPELPELIQKLWKCPFGTVGSRLWVAETWSPMEPGPINEGALIAYRAEYMDDPHGPDGERSPDGRYRRWNSAATMPQWASRLSLEVKSVRVQRLQDISGSDAAAEGVCAPIGSERNYGVVTEEYAKERIMVEWNSIHGPGSWESNPWVFAGEVEVVSA